jgi:8-oxo-dGTP pyrophosphatase MutT (NUDIX family)
VGKEVTDRNGVIGIVRNPKDNSYLCLLWKHADWTTFVTGGIEDEEDALEAVTREIMEETGYTDLKLIANLGSTRSEFFASHKDVNRIGHTTSFLFELVSETRAETSDEEISNVFGLAITMVTTAKSRPEGLALFEYLGFPLKKEDEKKAKRTRKRGK